MRLLYITTRFTYLAHTSAKSFADDMATGAEKWRSINSGESGGGTLKQVTKFTTVERPISSTKTYNLPPVEILKFMSAGGQDTVITVSDFF